MGLMLKILEELRAFDTASQLRDCDLTQNVLRLDRVACMASDGLAYCGDRGIAGYNTRTAIVAWIAEPILMVLTKRPRV